MFLFYTETESIDVLIERKQTEDQPKQFDRDYILIFFYLGLIRFFLVSFVFFDFGLFRFEPK
jgi:hypothetical protein